MKEEASGPHSSAIYLVVISLAVSPHRILAAVYLNEYAANWFSRLINQRSLTWQWQHRARAGRAHSYMPPGLCICFQPRHLAIMTLPVIIASTRRRGVPAVFGGLLVGATRWQTIWAVVLPNAISGILTGVILQVSRAAGETAPIMFTGAVFFKAVQKGDLFPYGLHDQCMALSMHLYTLSTQVPGVKIRPLRDCGRPARLGAAGERHCHRRRVYCLPQVVVRGQKCSVAAE
jgi:phosphate transport system permease protein